MKSPFLISFKITGLLTGLVSWGWRGMLIGFLLGYLLDKQLDQWLRNRNTPEEGSAEPNQKYTKEHAKRYAKKHSKKDEQLFFQLTYQMLGYLAKADGQVSDQEVHTVEYIMSSMALTADERLVAIQAFNIGKGQKEPPQQLIKAFKQRFRQRSGKKMEWLHYQFQLIYAEGNPSENIIETLGMSAFYAGVSPDLFKTTHQQYHNAWQNNKSQSYSKQEEAHTETAPSQWLALSAAYQQLGVPPDCDARTLKKAYRQKISKAHPDKLAGQNPSPSTYAKAKERSQEIQAAYQLIKKSRQGLSR